MQECYRTLGVWNVGGDVNVNKFRAWNPQKRIMSYDFCEINTAGDNIVASVEDGELVVKYLKEPLMHYRESPTMEPTGLYDKRKIMIWEGDVLKIPVDLNKEHHGDFAWYEVTKRHGQWFISYLKSQKGFQLPKGFLFSLLLSQFEYNAGDMFTKKDYYPETNIEVVGNVYEHSHLFINNKGYKDEIITRLVDGQG